MNLYLLMLICILAIFHRGQGRISSLAYAIIFATQAVTCDALEGLDFFLSAAVADTLILIVICSMAPVSRLSDILVSVTMLSWINNAVGAVLWNYNQPLDPYYSACTTLYILVALSMLWEDATHDTGRGFISSVFRFVGAPGLALRRAIHGEAS